MCQKFVMVQNHAPPEKKYLKSYSPQLSAQVSATIRRLAWSMDKPMTQAISALVFALPAIIDHSKICMSCKDKSDCKACIFCRNYTAEEKAALVAVL